jgi:hypothetical protein
MFFSLQTAPALQWFSICKRHQLYTICQNVLECANALTGAYVPFLVLCELGVEVRLTLRLHELVVGRVLLVGRVGVVEALARVDLPPQTAQEPVAAVRVLLVLPLVHQLQEAQGQVTLPVRVDLNLASGEGSWRISGVLGHDFALMEL